MGCVPSQLPLPQPAQALQTQTPAFTTFGLGYSVERASQLAALYNSINEGPDEVAACAVSTFVGSLRESGVYVATLETPHARRETVLTLAASLGRVQTIRALGKRGDVDPNEREFGRSGPHAFGEQHSYEGRPPITVAMTSCLTAAAAAEVVRVLLHAFPTTDINAVADTFNATPLHFAVVTANVACVKLLLDAGASVHARTFARRRYLRPARAMDTLFMYPCTPVSLAKGACWYAIRDHVLRELRIAWLRAVFASTVYSIGKGCTRACT